MTEPVSTAESLLSNQARASNAAGWISVRAHDVQTLLSTVRSLRSRLESAERERDELRTESLRMLKVIEAGGAYYAAMDARKALHQQRGRRGEVLQLYRDLGSVAKVAASVGLSQERIRQILADEGVRPRLPATRQYQSQSNQGKAIK